MYFFIICAHECKTFVLYLCVLPHIKVLSVACFYLNLVSMCGGDVSYH